MKVKCLKCGLVYGVETWRKQSCPQCSEVRYVMKLEDFEKIPSSHEEKIYKESFEIMLETYNMAKSWLEERGYMTFRKTPEDPFKYRIEKKEEGLAFEIIDIKDDNKVRVRKVYLNGHIEGFEGNPLVTNHMLPKIMALKALLRQMNKDYRDLIEAYMIRGLPLENVPLHELYMKEMEGIENIKI